MQIIIHRVNNLELLKKVPNEYGVEIDIRGYGSKILLNHDPIDDPMKYLELEIFLEHYRHNFIIFNMKEAGYEKRVIDLAAKNGIDDYFLLDVEFPYLYTATRKDGIRKIAVRYSEAEPVEVALSQVENGRHFLDWVWVDTITRLPLDQKVMKKLEGFKVCLVCPERWGRPKDIKTYRSLLKKEGIKLDAVMTSLKYSKAWL